MAYPMDWMIAERERHKTAQWSSSKPARLTGMALPRRLQLDLAGAVGLMMLPWAVRAQQPVASVPTSGVSLKGAMTVADGRATLANNGEVTAGDKAATVTLQRGGTMLLCASTAVQIAKDSTRAAPGDAGLLFSLNRGAFETSYTPGAYSDVILTPDLRLLVSGPGQANVKVRVNGQGDTCVDNPGEHAPYVIASSLADGGAYRVRPGQRVLFVGGSLQQVVDNEQEPCGCPPVVPVAMAGNDKSGGPSSTAADTAFPTAVSEGLQAPPTLAGSPPVVLPGEAHAQVSATLSSATPPGPPPAAARSPATKIVTPAAIPAPVVPVATQQKPRGLFGNIGHFFAKVFGAS